MAVDIANVTSGGDITFTGASGALYSWSSDPGNSEVSPTPNAFHVWSLSRNRWIRLAPGQSLADDAGESSVVALIGSLGSSGGGFASTGPVNPRNFEDDEETATLPGAGLIATRGDIDDDDDELDISPQVVAGTIGLGALIALITRVLGPVAGRLIGSGVGALSRVGGRIIPWNSIPSWIRNLMIAVGITEGTSIIIEELTDIDIPTVSDLLPTFGGGGHDPHIDPINHMVQAMTVSTWRANNVQFHRLSDGRLAVRNKHGVWKVWRPKKPIVLFASGATDLPTLLRAERAMDKQFKRIAKALRSHGYHAAKK